MTTIDSKLCLNKCGKTAKVKFCSRSCAASYNNRLSPKRQPEHICRNLTCTTRIPATKWYCSEPCKPIKLILAIPRAVAETGLPTKHKDLCSCGKLKQRRSDSCLDCRNENYLNTTIGELRAKSVRNAQVYNALRGRSRNIAKQLGVCSSCEVCGYSYRVEIAHIRGLSTLPDHTTVREATDRNNFFALCPNHHHEFDDGAMTAEQICTVSRSRTKL